MISEGQLDRADSLASHPALRPEREPLWKGSSAEVRLRGLCAKVLGMTPASLDDNLFERGFDSLSAASLAWLIEKEFHVRILLSDVLADPTLEKLLGIVEDGRRDEPGSAHPYRVNGSPHLESIPLSFALPSSRCAH